jgi:hypothetical protein
MTKSLLRPGIDTSAGLHDPVTSQAHSDYARRAAEIRTHAGYQD